MEERTNSKYNFRYCVSVQAGCLHKALFVSLAEQRNHLQNHSYITDDSRKLASLLHSEQLAVESKLTVELYGRLDTTLQTFVGFDCPLRY